MKNKLFRLFGFSAFSFFAATSIALAQAPGYVTAECTGFGIEYALCRIALILNTLIPILITLGVVYFIYGVITYVIAKDEEAKSRGRNVMIYGLIGLAVIVSVWGLVNLLKATFGVPDSNTISVPCIESPGITCPQNN